MNEQNANTVKQVRMTKQTRTVSDNVEEMVVNNECVECEEQIRIKTSDRLKREMTALRQTWIGVTESMTCGERKSARLSRCRTLECYRVEKRRHRGKIQNNTSEWNPRYSFGDSSGSGAGDATVDLVAWEPLPGPSHGLERWKVRIKAELKWFDTKLAREE